MLAVVDELSPETEAITELADQLGAGFTIELWNVDGDTLTANQHLARLRRLAFVDQCEAVTLATAPWQFDAITDAAGPVIAWGGI